MPYAGILIWLGDLFFLLLDLLGFPALHRLTMWLSFRKLRPLTSEEIDIVQPFFLDKVDYTRVRIFDNMSSYFKKLTYAFVSFNIINYRNELSKASLVHEMVHIWQYQTFGSPYLFRALLAQYSHAGYDYGGLRALNIVKTSGGRFIDFNFEQQGDIFSDAYNLVVGLAPNQNAEILEVYRYFIDQVRFDS